MPVGKRNLTASKFQYYWHHLIWLFFFIAERVWCSFCMCALLPYPLATVSAAIFLRCCRLELALQYAIGQLACLCTCVCPCGPLVVCGAAVATTDNDGILSDREKPSKLTIDFSPRTPRKESRRWAVPPLASISLSLPRSRCVACQLAKDPSFIASTTSSTLSTWMPSSSSFVFLS